MKTLKERQALFCREYLKDLNATQAAIRAGYSVKTARNIGNENLTKPAIQAYVQQLCAERAERVQLDADYVVRNLIENIEIAMGRKPKKKKLFSDKGLKVVEVCENDVHGANRALELLGKHRELNLWKEIKQVESNVTGYVVVPAKEIDEGNGDEL